MSADLVPLVTLYVTDLQQENDKLKSQLKEQESQLKKQEDKQLLVQITGPNQAPIHFEGSMKYGYSDGGRWILSKNRTHTCNVTDLTPSSFIDSEAWLGGIFIGNCQDVDELNFYEFNNGIGYFCFRSEAVIGGERGRCPIHAIYGTIRPMTYDNYILLVTEELFGGLNSEELTTSDMRIEAIEFRKDNIPGIMSLLEKLGISTSDDNNDDDDDDNNNDDNGDANDGNDGNDDDGAGND